MLTSFDTNTFFGMEINIFLGAPNPPMISFEVPLDFHPHE